MLGRKRQRDWSAIAADPHTPYMVGRLLGANEMAVALLRQEKESVTAAQVAEVLAGISSFFMEEMPLTPQRSGQVAISGDTTIISPPK